MMRIMSGSFFETLSRGLKTKASADRMVKPHQIKFVNDRPSNERFDALERKTDMICQKMGGDVSLVLQVQALCEICGDMGHIAFICAMNLEGVKKLIKYMGKERIMI
ncbi:putative transcription factor interactor and regulator CCHC(Zn) family [Helianthus annuus]|nr:putative transcription factor interactor and regulator CCHC(Zn) family [Helianthus annuus]KAJ0705690.1 putative transcription factor interactor and regulator CCHC(Zn) family [Helianthus annuus]KAJ0885980.1 putative transcription factor interactor and regulator CCHC(Zn) family [Helianthus annuus]